MEKVLELVFKDAKGDKKVITVNNPKEDVTADEANAAMAAIVAADVFETSGGALTEAVEARVKVTEVTVLQ